MSGCCPNCGYDMEVDKPIERDGFIIRPYGDPERDGRSVYFTPNERSALWAIVKAGDVAISYGAIAERQSYEGDSNHVNVYICRMRAKFLATFGINPIQTVRGRGYRWVVAL